jgi:hypothetical protein
MKERPPPDAMPTPGRLARSRRLTRGGRAAVAWAVIFFAAAQIGLDFVIEHWRPTLAERVYRDKWDQLGRLRGDQPDRPLLVMLGSSRALGGFDAGRLDGLADPDGRPLLPYNFGVPMFGPVRALHSLREMLDAGVRPRLLLVEVSPLLLHQRRRGDISEEGWISVPWLGGAEFIHLRPYLTRPGQADRLWLQSRLAPWYTFRFNLQRWLQQQLALVDDGQDDIHYDPWGRVAEKPHTREECSRRLREARFLNSPSLSHFRLGPGPSRALRDLLGCCRHEGIPAVLVVMPESTTFRSWYLPEGRVAVRRLLADLRAEFGVPIIDATRWVRDDEFADGHHLLPAGARRFTGRLAEELRPVVASLGKTDEPR